jgi:GNAT superfamily N-acetyltransferase
VTDPIEQLTRRWVTAWANLRRLDRDDVAGWPIVYVGSASRATEIVCAEPDAGTWAALLEQVAGEPTAMLSVVSARPECYVAGLAAGLRVERDDETLMRFDHAAVLPNPARLPDVSDYEVERDSEGDRLTIRLVREGRVAAEGTAGISGQDAVYDMVETTPAFRRRGLASWVMAELTDEMRGRGARAGLLVATSDGATLYRGLGWVEVAPVRSVTGE